MELRSIALSPEKENIARTYRAIAETMPQSVVSDRPDVLICLAPFAHPLCNFAIVWAPSGVDLALQAAEGRPYFCIYTFERSWVPPRLALSQEMTIMRGLGNASSDSFSPAASFRERLIVARFMCQQFFGTQSRDIRERMAEATARVPELELFTLGNSKIIAAGMLNEGQRIIGLYNICVDGALRRRGWGASIVNQLLSECAHRDKPAVLQCGSDLVPWYGRLGFRAVGKLFAWSVSGK